MPISSACCASVNSRSVRPERSIVHALPIGYAHRRAEGRQGSARPGGREAVGRCRGDQRRDAGDAQYRAGAQSLPPADRSADGDALCVGPRPRWSTTKRSSASRCIDFGGATTTVAVFAEGHLVYCDAIAIGGHHLTLDIARQLSVSVADAERLKTVYGSRAAGPGRRARDDLGRAGRRSGRRGAGADPALALDPHPPPARRGNSRPPSATACRPPA